MSWTAFRSKVDQTLISSHETCAFWYAKPATVGWEYVKYKDISMEYVCHFFAQYRPVCSTVKGSIIPDIHLVHQRF